MEHYVYPPLESPTHIRLIRIFPGNAEEVLHGFMFQVQLGNVPPYQALSYVWGNDTKSCRVETPEGLLLITASLNSAFKRFRQAEHPTVLWADAVCIDQDSNQERSSQIRLMTEIYRQALSVLAYLGEEKDGSALVPDLIDRLANTDFGLEKEQWFQGNVGELSLPPDNDQAWKACRAIWRRPWWRRVWILQEFIVAREAMIICGSWNINWEVFTVAIHKARAHQLIPIHSDTGNDHDGGVAYAEFTAAWRLSWARASFQEGNRSPLLGLLGIYGMAEATRARDHAFALLGFAGDAEDTALDPDYDSPLEDVFTRYASFFIQRDKSLDVLLDAGSDAAPSRFPSWVPNWTISKNKIQNRGYWQDRDLTSVVQSRFGDNPKILILRGGLVDHIDQAGKDHILGPGDREAGKALHPLVKRFRDSDKMFGTLTSYPTGEDLPEVYWRTLIANRTTDSQVPERALEASYKAFREYLHVIEFEKQAEVRMPKLQALWPEMEAYSKPLLYLYEDMVFCVTRKGYMGLVPPKTQADDVIGVFLGGAVPFVLRRCEQGDGSYFLLGGCYIHGIMNGEALASPTWHEEEIFLR